MEDLSSDQEAALLFADGAEQLYLQVIVLQRMLNELIPPEEDWRSVAEGEMALNEASVRATFDQFRLALLGLERESPPKKDWVEVVRQLLEERKPY